MVECVNSSLHLYMNGNATFLCKRLCAEYPSEAELLFSNTQRRNVKKTSSVFAGKWMGSHATNVLDKSQLSHYGSWEGASPF